MSRRVIALFGGLVIASLMLSACTQGEMTPEPGTGNGDITIATPTSMVSEPGNTPQPTDPPAPTATQGETAQQPATPTTAPTTGGGQAPGSQAVGYGSITDRVIARGSLICGSRTDLAGFGFLDPNGRNVGFDVDFCRAVAAGVLGDPEAVEFALVGTPERGPALQSAEVDMMARNMTWTSTREADWGTFTWITFYDGQGFMVRSDAGVSSIDDLDGATVCVTSGTTTELNLADAFRQRNLQFDPVVFEDTASVYGAYQEGRCDAVTSDLSQLASLQSGFTNPDEHIILDVAISKEPLAPAVPAGDEQWADIVRVIIWGLVNAEELGITQANVGEMVNSDNIEIRRLLGSEGTWGQATLGLPNDVMATVIEAVGNYGEIYDRYMGPEGMSFSLNRGLNNLWNEGGVMYAPPLR
jgi:general L-amino acid transport system substrate-binding protein